MHIMVFNVVLLSKQNSMLKKGFYIFTILLTSLALTMQTEAATRKHVNRKRGRTVRTHYTAKRKVQDAQNSEARAAFLKQDSLLNAPEQKEQIVYSDKDIPCEYILKLDSALQDFQANNKIETSPCNFDTTQQVLLSDSLYMSRLQSIPSIVELTYNKVVRDYIALYTIRKRKLTSLILGQSEYYFPIFDDALDAEGVPYELKYLPVIESALNAKAYSPAGASGLWQFISSTGRMYGLKINSLIDERRDPIKASYAAARYLKHLYKIYNNWTLVIAAYNCGPGNVNKAIRKAGGIKDYWAIYPYLPQETRGYVPAFIAATYTMNFSNEHGICPRKIERTSLVDTVHVSDQVHFKQIASVLDIDINELRQLNPQYRADIIPGNPANAYTLTLPTEKLNQYEMYKNTILAYEVPGYDKHRPYVEPAKLAYNRQKKHVTKPTSVDKDTVKKVDIDTTVKDSVDNGSTLPESNLVAQNKPQVQQKQQVQKKQTVSTKKTTVTAKNESTKYTVKAGDTLYAIASRNKVSVVNLKKWNSLESDNLRIGQVIVVQAK